ncbi:MAG: hypothetical protein JWQ30_1666, partial [Sediminibacterium sp.]|nr:hypothetical protein [Sediminibacterium sp.]
MYHNLGNKGLVFLAAPFRAWIKIGYLKLLFRALA